MTKAAETTAGRGKSGFGPVRILVADADCALYGLLEEWFAESGWELSGACAPGQSDERCDLIVVDLPFPRDGGQDVLRPLMREYPGTPIIALSGMFLPGAGGALARELGVTSVLPKPVTREALLAAVHKALASR